MQFGGYIDLPPTFTSIKGRLDNTGLSLIYDGANSQKIEWYSGMGTFAGQIGCTSQGRVKLSSSFGVGIGIDTLGDAITITSGDGFYNNIDLNNSKVNNIRQLGRVGVMNLGYTTHGIADNTTLQISTDTSLIAITSVGTNAGISHIYRSPGTTAPAAGDIVYILNASTVNHIAFRGASGGTSNIRTQNGNPGNWSLYKRSIATLIYYGGYWHVQTDTSQ